MPGLGGRIETLTKAKISHLLDRAEDPAETLDYAYTGALDVVRALRQRWPLGLVSSSHREIIGSSWS